MKIIELNDTHWLHIYAEYSEKWSSHSLKMIIEDFDQQFP